jgi:hypothetical protein
LSTRLPGFIKLFFAKQELGQGLNLSPLRHGTRHNGIRKNASYCASLRHSEHEQQSTASCCETFFIAFLSVTFCIVMLNVSMLSVVMLKAVAPKLQS